MMNYERVSGQCVNLSKSLVYFSKNVSLEIRHYLCQILPMNVSDSLGSYHGLPSSFLRGKTRDFQFLLYKVWVVLQGWKGQLFSQGGK